MLTIFCMVAHLGLAMGQIPYQIPQLPADKAIQLKNSQAALNRFTDIWTNPVPRPIPIPQLIIQITGGGSYGESLNPFFMSGYNEKQMTAVMGLWPFSADYRKLVIGKFAICNYLVGDQVYYDGATKTATYIRVVYIKEGPTSTKYVALKSSYQITFDVVKDKKALGRFVCYLTENCKPDTLKEMLEIRHYMSNKANVEFVSSQSGAKASIEKNLEAYERYLPDGYHVPALCKLPQIDDQPSGDVCDYREQLLNQAAGVMQAFRADEEPTGTIPESQLKDETYVLDNVCGLTKNDYDKQLQTMVERGVINAPLRDALASAVETRIATQHDQIPLLQYAVRETFTQPADDTKKLNYVRVGVVVQGGKVSMLNLMAQFLMLQPVEAETVTGQPTVPCASENVVCKADDLPDALVPTEQSKVVFEVLLQRAIKEFAEKWQKMITG